MPVLAAFKKALAVTFAFAIHRKSVYLKHRDFENEVSSHALMGQEKTLCSKRKTSGRELMSIIDRFVMPAKGYKKT